MPHGDMFQEASNKTILAAGQEEISSGFYEVGGYRSIVVAIKNTGANDIDVTPGWDFYQGSTSILPTETQRVLAGTSKRMLFQNQGDTLPQLRMEGVGGNSTASYQLFPANLDPLPSSAPDYLILYGETTTSLATPVGDSDNAKFVDGTYVTNDTSLWSFVLDGSGRIKEIDTSALGRYEVYVAFKWYAAAGSVDKTLTLNLFGAGPILQVPTWRHKSAEVEMDVIGGFTELRSGTLQTIVGLTSSADTDFVAPYLWFIRHPLSR